MGTRFEVLLDAPDADAAKVRAIGEAIIEEVGHWHRALSAFEPASVVAALNRAAGSGAWTPVDARVARSLAYAERVRGVTDGALDLCWRTRAEGHLDRIEVDGLHARLTREGQVLDLGCLGKGLALDGVAELLGEHGFDGTSKRALVHGGTSSILAIGAWTVGVRLDADGPVGTLELRDSHMSVSSNRHRAHVVLGGDGRGATGPRQRASIAVICPVGGEARGAGIPEDLGEGVLAEVWSTALVAGADSRMAPGCVRLLGA
jgi:thiamine biosynthesis lipoprotein ApbE